MLALEWPHWLMISGSALLMASLAFGLAETNKLRATPFCSRATEVHGDLRGAYIWPQAPRNWTSGKEPGYPLRS
jgi:hypothetical protein